MKGKREKAERPAAGWKDYFVKAGVATDNLTSAKSERGTSTVIGKFLAPLVGREVPVEVEGRRGMARLCIRSGRSRTKEYYFEVTWERESQTQEPRAASGPKPKRKRRKRSSGRKRGKDREPSRRKSSRATR